MRSMIKALVAASAGFAMFALPAAAEYQDDMREMREMVLKLQDQVQAQQEQIDDQKGVIREAGLEDERGSASLLSSFLESTDFSGWVASSYFYNFNNPRQPNSGGTGTFYEGGNGPFSNPFHRDHNSFQFDEAWFVVDRSPTEESPAGYHFEIVYGATASAIQGSSAHLQGNDFWIPSANVSYMAPWEQTLTAGKFATTIGYEVAGAPSNINITRGFVYNLFQPIDHTGVLVSQDFDSGFTYTLGVVNGFGVQQPDTNIDKGMLWQIGWGNDTATVLFNGFYTNEIEGDGRDKYVLDLVTELTPADNVVLWLNFDYMNTNQDNKNPWGVGLAVGGRVGVTDDLGIGARGEYAHFDDKGVAFYVDGNGNARNLDGDLWSFTGTIDYALTDNLTWKVEGKYEKGRSGMGQSYKDGDAGVSGDATFLGTQLYYEF